MHKEEMRKMPSVPEHGEPKTPKSLWGERAKRDPNLPSVKIADVYQLLEAYGVDPQSHHTLTRLKRKLKAIDGDYGSHVSDFLNAALVNASLDTKNSVSTEALQQAMLLGSDDGTRKFVQRVRGRPPDYGPWVSRDRLLSYVSQQERMIEHLWSIPCALVAFCLLCFLLAAHAQVQTASEVMQSMETRIVRSDFVTGFPEPIWAWVDSRAEAALVAPNLEVIGGVRISKLTEEGDMEGGKVICDYSLFDYIYDALHGKLEARPNICGSGGSDATFWQHWPLQRESAKASTIEARSRWEGSSGFMLQMLVHNPRVHVYATQRISLHFDSAGFPVLDAAMAAFDDRPAWIDWRDDLKHGDAMRKAVMVLDGLFLAAGVFVIAMLGLKTGTCLWSCCSSRRCCSQWGNASRRSGRDVMELCAWTFIDVLLFYSWVSSAAVYLYRVHLIKGLNLLIADLPTFSPQLRRLNQKSFISALLARSPSQSVTQYEYHLDAVSEQAQRIADSRRELCWLAAVLMWCACLRLFKAFLKNPRMNLTMQTLRRAIGELGHLFLIVIVALCFFVLAGYVIFGGRLEAFSTLSQAIERILLFAQGVCFDGVARAMRIMGGVLGAIWVWLFFVIMVLVVFNIIIAVISWEYTQAMADRCCRASLHEQWRIASREWVERREANYASRSNSEKNVVSTVWHLHRVLRKALSAEAASAASRGVRLPPLLNTAAVADLLGIQGSPMVDRRIQPLLERAHKECGDGKSPVDVSDAMRLNCRVDSNVQEISRQLAAVDFLLNIHWEFEQAAREVALRPTTVEVLQAPLPDSPPPLLLSPESPTTSALTCVNCGNILTLDDNFCAKCGEVKLSEASRFGFSMGDKVSWTGFIGPVVGYMDDPASVALGTVVGFIDNSVRVRFVKGTWDFEPDCLYKVNESPSPHTLPPTTLDAHSPEVSPSVLPDVTLEAPIPRPPPGPPPGPPPTVSRGASGIRERGESRLLGSCFEAWRVHCGCDPVQENVRNESGSRQEQTSGESRQTERSWQPIDRPCRLMEAHNQQQFGRLEELLGSLEDDVKALSPHKEDPLYAKAEIMTDALINDLEDFEEHL